MTQKLLILCTQPLKDVMEEFKKHTTSEDSIHLEVKTNDYSKTREM